MSSGGPTVYANRISTGVKGLDEILNGGFLPGRAYLITGAAGTGKTTLGLHFLLSADAVAKPLFISFVESEEHLRENAASMGLRAEHMHCLDLTPNAEVFSEVQSYDIFSPSEIEREPIATSIRTRIEQLNPDRIFIDGFAQLRTIFSDTFQFLRMTQSLFRFAGNRGATVLVTATKSMVDSDMLEASADGIICLARRAHLRTVEVVKMRSGAFMPDRHALRITATGLEIFPESG